MNTLIRSLVDIKTIIFAILAFIDFQKLNEHLFIRDRDNVIHMRNLLISYIVFTSVIIVSNVVLYIINYKTQLSDQFLIKYTFFEKLLLLGHLSVGLAIVFLMTQLQAIDNKKFIKFKTIIFVYSSVLGGITIDLVDALF